MNKLLAIALALSLVACEKEGSLQRRVSDLEDKVSAYERANEVKSDKPICTGSWMPNGAITQCLDQESHQFPDDMAMRYLRQSHAPKFTEKQ